MRTESGLVSVLMPAYNAEQFIEQAVESILNQTYPDIELLITEDCSTDNTWMTLQKYRNDPRIILKRNSSNLGYLHTINNMFRECKGAFITFMDADDWSDPERIRLQVGAFANDPALGCAACWGVRVDGKGRRLSDITFQKEYADILSSLPKSFEFLGAALMVKREVLADIGGYDNAFDRIGSEHLHWGGKIILKYKTINIPEPLYYYRHLSNSFSNTNQKNVRSQLSGELAMIAIDQLKTKGLDIFKKENTRYYKCVMNYLFMKYNFWNDHFLKGLVYYCKGFFQNQVKFADRHSLVAMYFRKFVKQRIGVRPVSGSTAVPTSE